MTAATSGSRPSILAFASPQPIALPPCPATTSAADALGRVGLDQEGVRDAWAPARPASTWRVTSSDVRSAFDQPWPKERSGGSICGPSRILSDALARAATRGRPSRSCGLRATGRRPSRSRSSSMRLKTRAWRIGTLISTWKGIAHNPMLPAMTTQRPDAVVFDNDGLLLDTESVWTRAEQDLFERRGTRVHPGRQARAGRDLGRDRRRGPRAAAGRAGPGRGADRGAQRAGDRRARARGGGDGRRPRAAARAARARHADRAWSPTRRSPSCAARSRSPASRIASTSSSAPTKPRRRSRRPTPTSRPAGASASRPAPRSSPSRTRRPGSPRPAPPA